ncbi:hypothetical protein [Amycolatopsis sp. CB00013]|uniref:hypothetical protein n=1 Tax=Amycolatopsis sp. CB00013 TaxID=1703945 RepID=UPI0011613055|nr:hypothetical protein [Amycolatopsis sp. CB00013]
MSEDLDRSGRIAHEHGTSLPSEEFAGELKRLALELRKSLTEGRVPRTPSMVILEGVEALLARVQAGTEQNSKPKAES